MTNKTNWLILLKIIIYIKNFVQGREYLAWLIRRALERLHQKSYSMLCIQVERLYVFKEIQSRENSFDKSWLRKSWNYRVKRINEGTNHYSFVNLFDTIVSWMRKEYNHELDRNVALLVDILFTQSETVERLHEGIMVCRSNRPTNHYSFVKSFDTRVSWMRKEYNHELDRNVALLAVILFTQSETVERLHEGIMVCRSDRHTNHSAIIPSLICLTR